MTKENNIDRIIQTLHTLPSKKIEEVANFADYVLEKYNKQILNSGIEKLAEQSDTFQFLHDEEDLYTIQDIKEKY